LVDGRLDSPYIRLSISGRGPEGSHFRHTFAQPRSFPQLMF